MQKTLKFAIDKINILEESDSQLAILEVFVCCDGDNLNHIPIDTQAMKDAAPTLLNKFLVADFNGLDFEGHTNSQTIIGFFPRENNIHYVEQDGHTYLVANAVLSKIYSSWAYNVLLNDGDSCSVSMEITVLDSEIRDDGFEWVTSFVFNGVTCLGQNVQEACVGANAKIIKFSAEKADAYYKSYISHQYVDSDSFLKEGVHKMSEFSVGEKLGKSPTIKIDNSKESAKNSGSWSDPGASFLNKCLEASNHASLVKEGYAKVSKDVSGDLSVNDVGYPHHAFKDDSMVVDVAGVEAAYKRARQQGETGEIISHIERHRKELGLDKDDDKSKGGEKMADENKENMSEEKKEDKEFTSDANTEADSNAELNDKKAEDNKELADDGDHNAEKAKVMSADDNTEDKSDDSDKDTEDKSEDDVDWMAKAKEFESQLNTCMAENEELKKFKKQVEDEKMCYEVEATLSDVSDSMPKEEVDACRTMAKDFSLENIDAWKNAVKAKAFSFTKGKTEHTPYIAMQLPYGDKPKDDNGSLWSKY